MIVVGRLYCYTWDDLDDHFRRLQPNNLNLDLPGITHFDHESKVLFCSQMTLAKRESAVGAICANLIDLVLLRLHYLLQLDNNKSAPSCLHNKLLSTVYYNGMLSFLECEVESYDAVNLQWRKQRTLLYIGKPLSLSEENEGGQRVPYMVEYLSQEEPLGKYVGKRYKKPLGMEQYKKDVRCQMTARYYVGLFNEELYHKGKNCQ